jgi:hypothetical protein
VPCVMLQPVNSVSFAVDLEKITDCEVYATEMKIVPALLEGAAYLSANHLKPSTAFVRRSLLPLRCLQAHSPQGTRAATMAVIMRALVLFALVTAPVVVAGFYTPISTVVGNYQSLNSGESCVETISISSESDNAVPHSAITKGGVRCSDGGVLAIRQWVNVSSALRKRAQSLNTSDVEKVPYHEDALAAEISVFARGQDTVSYACGSSPNTGSSRQIYTWLDNVHSHWATSAMASTGIPAVEAAASAASDTDVFMQMWTPAAGYDAFSPALQSSKLSVIIVPNGQCWYKKL